MRWIDMVPSDLRRMAKDPGVCVIPIGSLERHGEHLPLGCDGVVAETVAVKAAEIEECVVFPTWYYGQVHEASCFAGTVNFPPEMMIAMLRQLLSQIASNGFRKIVFCNGHGGNNDMLRFLDMATMDEPRGYALYNIFLADRSLCTPEEVKRMNDVYETDIMGHADEDETSMYMACRPGMVRMDCVNEQPEPIESMDRLRHLPGIYSATWWYAMYPQNVGGTPTAASEEKGRVLLDVRVQAVARALRRIKEDTMVPALQEEFRKRRESIGTEVQ